MMHLSDPDLVVLGFLAVLSLSTLLAVIISQHRRLGRRETTTEAGEGSEWSMGFAAAPGRRYGLCLSFDIRYPGSEDDYGLVAEYSCSAMGRVLARERAGCGAAVPPHRDREIGTLFNCSRSSVPGSSRSRVTALLCVVGPFDACTEVTAAGRILAAEGNELDKAEVYFTRFR
ncbi:MAG: hypothetical protein JXA64_05830 [Candidatus Fermentibacteraceae bacterium]|nr:hypothetical protein [Candidatus Fermentibacteraceae bacterium]MBN2608615.1 hypothetical protein [Candidatus Fermentibacteraceae bacterium]